MNPISRIKAVYNSMALLGFGLCLTSCSLTSCAPIAQDVRAPEEPMVINTSTDLSSKLGKPVYLKELVSQYGSAQAAFNAVINYEKVVIDFYADWCGPCRALGKALVNIAADRTDVLIVKVDVDEFNDIAGRYGVRSIPTLIFFKNGNQVYKASGFNGEGSLKAQINSNL